MLAYDMLHLGDVCALDCFFGIPLVTPPHPPLSQPHLSLTPTVLGVSVEQRVEQFESRAALESELIKSVPH